MATGAYFNGFFQARDDDDEVLALGKVEAFVAGTSDHKDLYTSADLATPHPWPYVLEADGRGRFFLGAGVYDLILKDADGNIIDELEGIQAAGSSVKVVSTTTTPYTVTYDGAQHVLVLMDASAGNKIVNLPALAAEDLGRTVTVKKVDGTSNSVTIEGFSTERIDADLNKDLRTQWAAITQMEATTFWAVTALTSGLAQNNANAGGRLTTETGRGVPRADAAALSVLYYTPYKGNLLSLYTGAGWQDYTFAELSINFSSENLVTGAMYDCFIKDVSGVLTMMKSQWRNPGQAITGATNATPIVVTSNSHGFLAGDEVYVSGVVGNTAANGTWIVANVTTNTFELVGSVGSGAYTAGGWVAGRKLTDLVTWFEGVPVRSSDTTQRYVGSFAAQNTTGVADDLTRRHVWNMNHRVKRRLFTSTTQNSWSHSLTTPTAANGGDATLNVSFVVGIQEDAIRTMLKTASDISSAVYCVSGIGRNRTNGFTASQLLGYNAGPAGSPIPVVAILDDAAPPGLHTDRWLDVVDSGTGAFYGDNNGAYIFSGLQSEVWC